MTGSTYKIAGAVAGVLAVNAIYALGFAPPEGTENEVIGIILFSVAGGCAPDFFISEKKASKPTSGSGSDTAAGNSAITHSLLFLALPIFLAFGPWQSIGRWLLLFAVGVLSHLILDLFTPQGVPLLWPVKKNFSVASLTTGGCGEILINVALWGCMVVVVMTWLAKTGFPVPTFVLPRVL